MLNTDGIINSFKRKVMVVYLCIVWYRYNIVYIVLSFCRKWSKSFTAVSQPSDCYLFFSSAISIVLRVSGKHYDSVGWRLYVDITSKLCGKSEWVDMYTLHLY